MKQKAEILIKGFCMGAADVIPGVSGGTMAFILGIYRELIDAIKSFNSRWLVAIARLDARGAMTIPHFGFVIPLAAGIIIALLFFTRVIPLPVLLVNHPEEVYSLFFGLILGSVIVLFSDLGKISLTGLVSLFSGTLAGYAVFNMIPVYTPETAWFVFISGALAICAMVLPGVSGSFVLLILNKYSYIFNAIGHFQWQVLLPFALGALSGLVVASRLLSWLLSRYYRNTVLLITGLLLASLTVIWPYQERVYTLVNNQPRLVDSSVIMPAVIDLNLVFHLLLCIAGLLIVTGLDRLKKEKNVM